jgi:hypothetical protein
VIAMTEIAVGVQVTMDYAMFESEDGEPGQSECRCNAQRCRGRINGRADLPEAIRAAYRGFLASHLTSDDWRLPDASAT